MASLISPMREETVLQPSRPSDLTSRMGVKFTLKRMTPLLLPAIAALFIPPLLSISIEILNIVSKGYGVVSLLSALAFTTISCFKIKQLAPSPQKLEQALQSRNRLFSLSLLASLLLYRCIVSKIMPVSLKSQNDLDFASLSVGARFATGVLFLSVLVMLRFVGPAAVAQCSTFPLHSNPYEKFLYNIGSFQRFLNLLMSHDEVAARGNGNTNRNANANANHARTQSTSDSQSQDKKHALEPKRFKSPTFTKTVIQIFLHGYFGALFAQSTVSPILLSRGVDAVVVYHVTCSCALLASLTFVATYITCERNHELTSKLSSILGGLSTSVGKKMWRQIQISGFLFYWLVIPFLGLFLIWLKEGGTVEDSSMTLGMSVQAVILSHVVTAAMALYIMSCDIMQREILLQPGLNVHRFIQKSGATEENVEVEDVIVEIILSGFGRKLLENIISPRLNVDRDGRMTLPNAFKKRGIGGAGITIGECDLEQEELRRNDAAIMVVKRGIEMGRICGHTSLEDDLLKMCVLEGLSTQEDAINVTMGLSELRHREMSRNTCLQPTMVPVLRSISAYVGGIGASLSDPTSTLSIPPSAKTSLEYAVKASTRIIILNMVGSDVSGRVTKKYNRISLMLPVVLESVYRLRCGIYDHALNIHERASCNKSHAADVSTNVGINNRGPWTNQIQENLNSILSVDASLEHLVNVCDEAASIVLQAIKDIDGSRFDAKVGSEGCKQWLESF
mmetsp:Transcript_21800/g.32328  ORF Transcript_21800/g.32328 Transcript_21800/m.32328 type:complete len:734 (-) Transcript_21800:223-2424(-)